MTDFSQKQLEQLIEACLFVVAKPMTIKTLQETALANLNVSNAAVKTALASLQLHYQERGVQLVKVAGGYRFQSLTSLSPYLQFLWQEKAPKYSRATLETLAVIAYQQPVSRGDIEQVRGVAVSSQIIKSLQDRAWIKVIGHREVPGRPALYATTADFLAYFGLESITQLPPLSDPKSVEVLLGGIQSSNDE